jgi:hypothetical protein
MSPQTKNSDFGLYKYFRVASSLSMNSLEFADGLCTELIFLS